MKFFRIIHFIGTTFLVSSVFSKTIISNEYSKRDEIDEQDQGVLKWKGQGKKTKINIMDDYLIPRVQLDADGYATMEKSDVIENLQQRFYFVADDGSVNEEMPIRNGAIDIVDMMLRSTRNYKLKFIAGVISNLESEGMTGKFEVYSPKNGNYIVNMEEDFKYKEYYSGKHIYYDEEEEGLDKAVGICCTKWLAEQSNKSRKFGLGIAQWTEPYRIKGLINEYYNYIKDTDCEYENKYDNDGIPVCNVIYAKSIKKLSKAESYEIESKYFMKELEGEFAYIYDGWEAGLMKSPTDRYPEKYYNKDPSDAAMYFCLEFLRPAIDKNHNYKNRCNHRRANAERIYQLMIGQN